MKLRAFTALAGLVVGILALGTPASAHSSGSTASLKSMQTAFASSKKCVQDIKSGDVITKAIYATCKNGALYLAAPCTDGKPGQIENVGTYSYVLHVGHKATRLPVGSETAALRRACQS